MSDDLNAPQISRRTFSQLAAGSLAAVMHNYFGSNNDAEAVSKNKSKVLSTEAVGAIKTAKFYRMDIGTAPGRMHEPSADNNGNIWTSPLDGRLWRYNTAKGQTRILDLKKITGREWKGLHLWPVGYEDQVLLCTPSLSQLHIYNHRTGKVTTHDYPHSKPNVYGGFVVPGWKDIYLYDTRHAGVVKWNPNSHTGQHYPCPYPLTGTLYMTFAEPERQEIWGSTYTGNDIVRFDVKRNKWTGHFRCPLENATPTPGGRVYEGKMLYCSDHLNGRIVPLDVTTGKWHDPIDVPGYKQWFGYLSGGWHFQGKLYCCHSTWTGGNNSLDGKPHHFIGSWSVFDPKTEAFSRLDTPTRPGEKLELLMSDYCATYQNQLYLFAVNQKPPRTVIVLQTKPPADYSS